MRLSWGLVILAVALASLATARGQDVGEAKDEAARTAARAAKDQAVHDADVAAKTRAIAEEAAREAARQSPAQLAAITPLQGVAFERATFNLKVDEYPALNSALWVFGNGTCKFFRENGKGELGMFSEHTLAPERVRRLSDLLAKTDWFAAKEPPGPPISHAEIYTATVMRTLREGFSAPMQFQGREGPYVDLRLFLAGLLYQERLFEKVFGRSREGWQELDRYFTRQSKPPLDIDMDRYRPRMLELLREPLDTDSEQLAVAIRAMPFYDAKSERKAIEALAGDRSRDVREAVAAALADFGGPESILVLKGMVRHTPGAAFALVRLGKEAVPTIEALILGDDEALRTAMIRTYDDHWRELPRPVDERVVAAVRNSRASLEANNQHAAARIHRRFLELVEGDAKQAR